MRLKHLFIGLVIFAGCHLVESGVKLEWHYRFALPNVSDTSTLTPDIADNTYVRPVVDEQETFGVQLVDDVTGDLIDHTVYSKITAFFEDEFANNTLANETYLSRQGLFCIHDLWQAKSYHRFRRILPYYKFCMPHVSFTPYLIHDGWFYMYRGELFIRHWMLMNAEVTEKVFMKIDVEYQNTTYSIETPLFKILNDDSNIDHMELNQPLPTNIIANNPFTIQLKVVNKDGNIVSTGINSKSEVLANVGYTHKIWHSVGGPWLAETENVLGGAAVVSMKNDRVIYEKFDQGTVNITMQLEDVSENVHLNFTLKKPFYSYRRYPEDEYHPDYKVDASYIYFDNNKYTIDPKTNSTHVIYRYHQNDTTYFKGVFIANVSVKPQTPASFRIVPGHVMKTKQFTNYPIDHPLQVELLDDNGYRVTSGPDSNLTVTVHTDISDTCLSKDATFKLHRGIATFPGSICRKILSTQLYFKTVTSAGEMQTTKTATFEVRYKLDVISAHRPDFLVGEEMAAAALLYCHGKYYLGFREIGTRPVTSPEQFTEEIFKSINVEQDRILGLVGPDDRDDASTYAAVAEGYDIPIASSGERNSKFADKVNYPLYVSAAFPQKYDFLMLANIMSNRAWNKISVICTLDTPPPADFVTSAFLFGVTYEIVHFPKVKSNTTVLSDDKLSKFFRYFDDTKTRVVLPFLTGEELNYLVAEVSKRNYTMNDGYQWIGTKQMIDSFPFDNEGRCQSVTGTTCTDAFKGTIFIKPHYPTYGEATMSWAQMKEEFGDRWKKPYPLDDADEDTIIKAALYFDSAMVLVSGFRTFMTNDLTITPTKLMEAIKSTSFPVTLTARDSQLAFDEYGNRLNYTAYMMQIDGTPNTAGKANVLKKKRFLYLGDSVTLNNITKDNVLKEIFVEGETLFYANVLGVEMNTVNVVSTMGSMNQNNLKMSSGLMAVKNLNEKVPAPYYCAGGCGGNQLHADNVLLWEHGTCVKQGVCKCNIDPATNNPGYTGVSCQDAVCTGCQYGSCDVPSTCSCYEGYINTVNKTDCAIPTCLAYGCNLNNGECTSADYCKCKPNFYGKDCAKKCECVNGKCSDGESGSGDCVCDSGYMGSLCDTSSATIIVPTVIGVILLLLLIAAFGRYKYKQVQLMAALMSTDWKADWDTIRMRQSKQKSSMKSLMSMMSMMSAKSGKQDEKVVCQNQGQWNGRDVVIKQLRKDDIELTDDIRWEIKQMRDLKHPNLCMFIGAVTESPHVAILNEVCGKGSLEDILGNDDVELGWDFRYSMMKDICRGMQYLNGSDIVSHGRLKSSNCLVDNRWTVKLADYGMQTFKGNQHGVRVFSPNTGIGIEIPTRDELEQCDYYNLLWTAPEIIGTGVSHPNHVAYGTLKGDIYSFAIILVEMCTRHHPFHELDHLTPAQIVQMVGRLIDYEKKMELVECKDMENIPIKVLRPQVQRDELPNEDKQANGLYDLIQLCWNQDENCRPTFKDCMSKLNHISPHRGELMDNLIVLMEQYTNSLEAIVAERTSELREETEKTDLLLGKMLPPLIAEELKSGNNPKPEFFNCVTIYFSDVVGFGKLCADSSPYEVVELLNDLYNVMDDVIESFDCYKVETIGDCYVVASGLPVRNGDQHAGEVASMALQLLSSFNGIGYKHLANSQVQLRIGMHSGSIVAGVVGLKMPRYCLFGDTMNTASRMESGGFALKIHLSEETYKILEKLGGYQFICRGERQVKGRGAMTTYWLTGKDGADLNLPSEDLALSASQHDFK